MQWQISLAFSPKFQHRHHPSYLRHHFLSPAYSNLKKSETVSSSRRFSEILHLQILETPKSSGNSITAVAAAASKKGIFRKRRKGCVRSRAETALLLQCIASFVAWNLSLVPEPLDSLLLLLADGGGKGGLRFWKKGYGGGSGGPQWWKLGFLGLLLVFGTGMFLILRERGNERDLIALCRARFRMLPKWFGRIGRRRRRRKRLWAF